MKKSLIIYEIGKRQESYYIVTRAVTAILTLPGKNNFDHLGILDLFDPSLRFHGSETMQMIPDQGPFPLDLKIFRDHPLVDLLKQPSPKIFGWLEGHLRNFVPQPDLNPFDYFLVEFRRTPFFYDYCLESINRFFEKEKKPEAQKNDEDDDDSRDDNEEDPRRAKKRVRGANEDEGDDDDDSHDGDAESDNSDSDDSRSSDDDEEEEEETMIKRIQEEWKENEDGVERNEDGVERNADPPDNGIIDDMMNEGLLGQILFQSLLSDLIILSGEMNKRP
jgi:hypothetical protein